VHRALEHVAAAVRAPQVADPVVPARHVDARRAQRLDRRDGEAVDGGRQQRHAGLREPLEQPLLGGAVGLAEAVGVADRDASGEAAVARAVDDQLELPQPQRAAVVQVQVDAGVVACGELEDHVQVPDRVAVHAGGIDAADRLDPARERLFEQLGRAGVGQEPMLRERDLLDADETVELPRRRAHRLDAAQADLGVDVGVAAHVRRPGGDQRPQKRDDALDARYAQLAASPPVVRDPVLERVAGRVRHPRSAVQGLVEMAVRVDQARQHEPVRNVEHLDVRGEAGLDALDHPSTHEHVGRSVESPGPATTQQQIRHGPENYAGWSAHARRAGRARADARCSRRPLR
jgi:hypothetical protein